MSTDHYTEEDVERVAMQLWWLATWGKPTDWANPIIAEYWSQHPDVFRNRDTGEIDGRDSWRSFAKAAIDVISPLAFNAGALAMKEAAAKECDRLIQSLGLQGVYMDSSDHLMTAGVRVVQAAIRALPVPPRKP